MVDSQKCWGGFVAAAALLVGATVTGVAAGHAEEAVLVPGATVFKPINPLHAYLAETFYPIIGEHFHTDDDPFVVDYSQDALDADRAISDGVAKVRAQVVGTDGDVVVIGESMGAMVSARVAAELDNTPGAPQNVRFVLIAPPDVGVAEYFKEGTFIPVLNYRIARLPQSDYETTIMIGEYDGWADPPDRPWNVLSSANAILGTQFVHGPPIAATNPPDVPSANVTRVGNVTTYFVPTKNLPLTQPLRLIGVPDEVVDQADRVLRPIIDTGYVRHDKPGDTRPYLHDGEIRRKAAGAVPVSGSATGVTRASMTRVTRPLERAAERVTAVTQRWSDVPGRAASGSQRPVARPSRGLPGVKRAIAGVQRAVSGVDQVRSEQRPGKVQRVDADE